MTVKTRGRLFRNAVYASMVVWAYVKETGN
jgi:hypothetical protein